MAEQPVPQGQEAAPAETPAAPTSAEIQSLIAAEAQKQVDARIPKLQSSYERQIAGLRKEIENAKNPSVYDDDGGSNSQLEAELAKARREADALRAGRLYPEAFPVFEQIQRASSVEDQLSILQDSLTQDASRTPAPADPPAAPASEPTPPTDPNRPLEQPTPSTFDPSQMNQNLADRLIDSLGDRWPGR